MFLCQLKFVNVALGYIKGFPDTHSPDFLLILDLDPIYICTLGRLKEVQRLYTLKTIFQNNYLSVNGGNYELGPLTMQLWKELTIQAKLHAQPRNKKKESLSNNIEPLEEIKIEVQREEKNNGAIRFTTCKYHGKTIVQINWDRIKKREY